MDTAFNDPRRLCALTGSLPLLQKNLAGSGHSLFSGSVFFLKSFLSSAFSCVRFHLSRDGPDEAGEFAREGRDDHGRFLAPGAAQLLVAMVQTALRFPTRLRSPSVANSPGASAGAA